MFAHTIIVCFVCLRIVTISPSLVRSRFCCPSRLPYQHPLIFSLSLSLALLRPHSEATRAAHTRLQLVSLAVDAIRFGMFVLLVFSQVCATEPGRQVCVRSLARVPHQSLTAIANRNGVGRSCSAGCSSSSSRPRRCVGPSASLPYRYGGECAGSLHACDARQRRYCRDQE